MRTEDLGVTAGGGRALALGQRRAA